MTEENTNIEALAQKCIAICEEKKAANIVLFDVRENSELADYYLVCCGTSLPHIRALADSLRRELTAQGLRPRGQDGAVASQWIVLDYGSILIHIMSPEMRRYYSLEDLWDKRLIAFEGGEPMPAVKPGVAVAQGEEWEDDEAFDVDEYEDEEDFEDDYDDGEEFDDGQGDFEGDDEEFDGEDDGEDGADEAYGDEDDFEGEEFEVEEYEEEEEPPVKERPRGEPGKGYTLEELFGETKKKP